MRKLPLLIFLSLAVACGTNPTEERLAVADSLMQVTGKDASMHNSDSAYMLLSNLSIDSFSGNRNRSVFAIVKSHADFRHDGIMSVVDYTNLSEAVDYFSNHKNDKNYYPRACIMKSVAVSKLNDTEASVSESIRLYKSALESLSAEEHFWRGYAHYHLADLYFRNSISDSVKVRDHYIAAAKEYAECGDKLKEAWSYCELAKYYYLQPNDSMAFFIKKSMNVPLNEPDHYLEMMNLADLCVFSHNRHDYGKALGYIKESLAISKQYNILEPEFNYYLASCYAHLGYVDSAKAVLRSLGEPRPDLWRYNYARRAIAEAEGDYKSALQYADNNYRIRTNSLVSTAQKSMLRADLELSVARLEAENGKMSRKNYLYLLVILGSIAVLAVVVALNHRRKRKNVELLRANEQLHSDKLNLERIIKQIDEMPRITTASGKSEASNALINEQFKLLHTIFDDLTRIKDVDKIGNRLKARTFATVQTNFFKYAEIYLNSIHDNVIDRIRETNILKDNEIAFVIMDLCGFSNVSIQYALDFKNNNYPYKKRAAILKKLGVNSMDELVVKFKEER